MSKRLMSHLKVYLLKVHLQLIIDIGILLYTMYSTPHGVLSLK